MKAYIITTGAVFGLLTVAHLWRIVVEGTRVLDLFFVVITLIAAALSFWAWRLLRLRPAVRV